MCDTDFDPCDVWVETTQRARKAHRCNECSLPIKAGRHYIRVFTIFEGHADTYKAHAECWALMKFVEKEVCGNHGSIPLHGFEEEVRYLDDYDGGRTESDANDMLAMGFDGPEEDDRAGAKQVVEWLWDCVQAEYQEAR